jgi:hypothetical protein
MARKESSPKILVIIPCPILWGNRHKQANLIDQPTGKGELSYRGAQRERFRFPIVRILFTRRTTNEPSHSPRYSNRSGWFVRGLSRALSQEMYNAGMFIGAMTAGWFSGCLGRKRALILATLRYAGFSLLNAFVCGNRPGRSLPVCSLEWVVRP